MRPKGDAPAWEKRLDILLYVLANVSFAYVWLSFCIHLTRHWHIIDVHLRSSAYDLALGFLALWLLLVLHEKISGICLIIAYFAFQTASSLALRLF